MQRGSKSPNIERLFNYLQKSQWHNVTSHFAGFVRKDFNESLEKLDTDENDYVNLARLIEHVEMGRFSEAKDLMDQASADYQIMVSRVVNLTKKELSPRRYNELSPRSHLDLSPRQPQPELQHSDHYARDTYTPGDQRGKDTSPRRAEHDVPRTPIRTPMRTPMKATEPQRYPTPSQTPDVQDMETKHKQNYDSLRLNSPAKQPQTYQVLPVQHAYDQHPADLSPERDRQPPRQPPRPEGSKQSQRSHDEILGLGHGDKPADKVANSTYRMEFPWYDLENMPEREDKQIYRKNFGSLTERNAWMRNNENSDGDDKRRLDSRKSSKSSASSKSSMRSHKPLGTPELSDPNRPSELARRFGELYQNEWSDAYDEICKDFGSEKTVRHLLWVVTEAYMISNSVAERQLRDLEKSSFGLMTSPDAAHSGIVARFVGQTMPQSRPLLTKYRKQTSTLSIPYVKEECRSKICKTLYESSRFPSHFLTEDSRLVTFINACAELTWLMCVSVPPIVLEYITRETEGGRFNTEHYICYTKAGSTYDYGVWPMMRLNKNGQIIAKGVSQGI